jgi:hypothetical protein
MPLTAKEQIFQEAFNLPWTFPKWKIGFLEVVPAVRGWKRKSFVTAMPSRHETAVTYFLSIHKDTLFLSWNP